MDDELTRRLQRWTQGEHEALGELFPVVYAELPGAQHAFELFHSLRTRHVVHGVERFLERIHADYRAAREASRGGKRLRSAATTSLAPASTLSVPVLTTRS